MRNLRILMVLMLTAASAACTQSADDSAPALEISSSPAFVNRIIPGHRPVALVTVGAEGGKVVTLTATSSLEGAVVTMEPASVTEAQVSEVWITLPDVTEDVPFSVTVTATLGATTRSVVIDATAIAGTDDLVSTATDIAEVFLRELAATVPDIPNNTSGLSNGTPVAGLLVVSHYAWFTDRFEIGLSWHIMVAPDDFAELYIRPRDRLAPTRAFRINSWSTALDGGQFTLTEIAAPTEVTR